MNTMKANLIALAIIVVLAVVAAWLLAGCNTMPAIPDTPIHSSALPPNTPSNAWAWLWVALGALGGLCLPGALLLALFRFDIKTCAMTFIGGLILIVAAAVLKSWLTAVVYIVGGGIAVCAVIFVIALVYSFVKLIHNINLAKVSLPEKQNQILFGDPSNPADAGIMGRLAGNVTNTMVKLVRKFTG